MPRIKEIMKKMVLIKYEYNIKEETEAEYRKFSNDIAIPFWREAEGFKEMRAYVDPASRKVLVLIDYRDYESLGKLMDSEKYKEIITQFASYTKNVKWGLMDVSPAALEPIKPL
jgi:hypothetical protein